VRFHHLALAGRHFCLAELPDPGQCDMPGCEATAQVLLSPQVEGYAPAQLCRAHARQYADEWLERHAGKGAER